jgi:hypothetical protein
MNALIQAIRQSGAVSERLRALSWSSVQCLPAPGMSGAPQEAVTHEAGVKVEPRDRPRRVDAGGSGVRGIERGEGAVGGAQEAVGTELASK